MTQTSRQQAIDPDADVIQPDTATPGDATSSSTARPWRNTILPPEITAVPTMLSVEERQYLIWLTETKYEGWGAIAELGAFLGSSSVALAEGLRRKGSKAKIRAFDLFLWDHHMTEAVGSLCKDGDDFLPIYLRETAAYAPWIEAQKLDLMDASWSEGPIEILFVDSAKTWDLTNAILKVFGGHLVPGRSRVVLQDFRYPWAHCLPLIFDSRPDVWKQVEDLHHGTTVTFMPLKPLDGPCGIERNYAEESFPLASAEHLFKTRMAKEEPQNRKYILRALYRKYLLDGPLDQALKLREEIVAAGIPDADLKVLDDVTYAVGTYLHPRGWKAFDSGDYQRAREIGERCLALPGEATIYSRILLGFSLLRLGDIAGAKRELEMIVAQSPQLLQARFLRVEIAIEEGRRGDAAREALEILQSGPEESTIHWALCDLFRAWEGDRAAESHVAALTMLTGGLGQSPSFMTHLALAQFQAGDRPQAVANVKRALKVSPDYELAAGYLAQWTT